MQPSPNTIPIAYRPPFTFGEPWRDARPHGESVLEIVRSVPDLPREFLSRGVVCINGNPVPRELWSHTRPKPTSDYLPIAVTLHYPLGSPGGGGGGGSSSKSIIGLVAAIALVAVAATISGGALGVAGGIFGGAFLFGAGSTSASLLAGAVTIAGALAISALTAPPATQEAQQIADSNTENKESSAAQGNVLNPGGAIPRVIGSRKVYPPFICEPLVELVDADEYVEALYALNGPHLLVDVRVDGTDITVSEDIDYELREGWPTDSAVTLVTRQGKTITPQINLSQHKLADNNSNLLDQSTPTDDIPLWHGFVTRDSPDEVWVHLLFPGGINSAGGSSNWQVPLRIRGRKRGDVTWINFPEVHITDNSADQFRCAILFRWMATPAVAQVGSQHGFIMAHIDVPPQTITPATPTAWTADSYFDNGGGGAKYIDFTNEATTRVRNTNLYKNRVEFYLSGGTWPQGIWEFEIKRGMAYGGVFTLNYSTYVYNGSVRDFFWYQGTSPNIIVGQDQDNISDHCVLTRVASVWNDAPYVPTTKYFALIAIKARNRTIQRLSVQASGYVKDYGAISSGLLLQFAGADGSTFFGDSSLSAHTVTPFGSVQIDSAQSKFGNRSGFFLGGPTNTDYLIVTGTLTDFHFGPGDFTIHFWMRFNGNMAEFQNILDSRISAPGNWVISKDTSDKISNENGLLSTTVVTTGQWYHIAWTRKEGISRLFINGVLESTVDPDTTDYDVSASGLTIGRWPPGFSYINGWLDELTIINRTALWTEDFTPPTSEQVNGWNTWTTTSNPAPHYVDVLSGSQNLDPLGPDLRDDDGLIAWRTLCASNDWTCDAIVDDSRTQDVLALLASCAYAKPYQSDIYGVTVDNDRTADSPVQVFSRINAANVKFEKAFTRAPAGFIVSYRDESTDDDRAQTIVEQSDPDNGTTGLYETITYDGLVETDKVEARALFDLDQANMRSTFYSFETDIESIVCRRGSLVALQHDVLTSRAGDGHVYSVQVTGPNVTGITLDAEIDVVSGNTGVAIRHTDGTITTHQLSNATSSTKVLTFTTPFTDDGTIIGFDDTSREYGSLVVAGELSSEYKRMLVFQVAPGKDLRATVTLVDEAPDLVRF